MKKYIIVFITLLSTALQIQGGRVDIFSIAEFKSSERILNFKGNTIIRNDHGKDLLECDTAECVKPGLIMLRKKYEPGEYRLYIGRFDTAAFNWEPALYAFRIPQKFSFKKFIKFRLYSQETTNHSTDIDEVYFDDNNFYVRQFSRVYYSEDGIWYPIEGKRKYPVGSIDISSQPEGAQVIVNGISSLKKTPCILKNLPCGKYDIELFSPHHHFSSKVIKIVPDSVISLSFELLSDFDTVYISGNVPYGIVVLPQPPIDTPFFIDTMKIKEGKVNLSPGIYRLRWNGSEQFQSIDTTIQIIEGKVSYFDYIFQRRKGILKITTIPYDAEVCIDGYPCTIGDKVMELPTESYQVGFQRFGFQPVRKSVNVIPDTITELNIDLRMYSDRDGDGFLDSVDNCPDKYGLYDGCPKLKVTGALKNKKNEVLDFVKNDPFEIGFSLIGFISKIPTQQQFSRVITEFSNGRIGGVNNYRGLNFLNNYNIMYRGLFASVELGQWTSGIRYKGSDTLNLFAKDKKYVAFYDSLRGIEPVIYLPSTAVSFGFHYNWSWINIIYSIGYQWEDIVINNLYDVENNTVVNVTFDNDWWFHQIHFEAILHPQKLFAPSIYSDVKLPFGAVKRTRWHVIQAGFQMKLFPIH